MNLNGLELPPGYTGIGLHDTPGAWTADWDYPTSLAHAQMLTMMGVTCYKLFTAGAKVNRARAYVDAGIVPIVRPWIEEPWGRGLPVTPGDQLAPYIDAGVRLVELGNEWNIACEWAIPIPGALEIAQEVCDWWEVCLSRAAEVPGLIPLFPSNTPGGNVDHRQCYQAIIAELGARGLLGTVQHVAVHPRPHNNPPDVKWSSTNTVTFDEWRWIRDQFRAAGVEAYYWATEHGYSLNDDQNHNYPPITLDLWTGYSRELQCRMDPAHVLAIEPELAGHMHWYEAGWGHWGSWAKDAIRDSPAPEMPAPSPLWVWMEEEPLLFDRYTEQPDPPPPGERARGIDVSYSQPSFDWQAFDRDFAIIRVSIGRTLDSKAFRHDNQSGHVELRGGYHYLTEDGNGWRQARFAFALAEHLGWPLPFVVDVEADNLTADTIRAFVDRWYQLTTWPLMIYTSPGFWSQFGHSLDDVAARCLLWIAHWDVDEPTVPSGWDAWDFWQQGQALVPGYSKPVDIDVYNGTVAEMRARFLGDDPPPPPDPPYVFTVEHAPGLALVIGSYPVPGALLTLTRPDGSQAEAIAGTKPEFGPGGFELWAWASGPHVLNAEGWDYALEMAQGFAARCSWEPA